MSQCRMYVLLPVAKWGSEMGHCRKVAKVMCQILMFGMLDLLEVISGTPMHCAHSAEEMKRTHPESQNHWI